jgi:hypothetical protein
MPDLKLDVEPARTTEINKVHVQFKKTRSMWYTLSIEAHQPIILSDKNILSFICSVIIALE